MLVLAKLQLDQGAQVVMYWRFTGKTRGHVDPNLRNFQNLRLNTFRDMLNTLYGINCGFD